MFAYIKGVLEYIHKDFLVIDTNGVGYKIYTSSSTIQKLSPIGEIIKIHTHLHVREDAFILYGFLSMEELNMFEMLITVSGVGPKVALGMMTVVSPSSLNTMIISNDIKGLTKAPGIGSKTAQRIILDLKDKINIQESLDFQQGLESGTDSSEISEAIYGLIALGYTSLDAQKAVKVVATEDMKVQEIIKKALKVLVK